MDEAVKVGICHTINTVNGVHYGSVISPLRTKVGCTGVSKLLRGLLMVVFIWENELFQAIPF